MSSKDFNAIDSTFTGVETRKLSERFGANTKLNGGQVTSIKYIKELDGVRGIAALMVMFFHFFQANPVGGTSFLSGIQKITVFGQTGVTLFFVLSGFLITRILLRTKENNDYFSKFYIRRALRIFPLYYAFLCLTYFVIPIIAGQEVPPFAQQIYYWLYLQNFATTFNWVASGPGHFWSLAVEEHFYLFWPFIIYFLDMKRIEKAIIAIIALSLVVRIILLEFNYGVFYFTFTNMDSLAIGSLLALMELKGLVNKKYSIYYLLSLFLISIPTLVLWVFTGGQGMNIIQIIKFPLLSLSYMAFIGFLISLEDNNILKKWFGLKPLTYTGKVSYGLYVYHPICYYFYFKFVGIENPIINLIGCFVTAYLIASISYYMFEVKILELKKYFEYGNVKHLWSS